MPQLGKKLSNNGFYEIADDMIKDLEAVFNVLQDEMIELLNKPENQGMSEEELINYLVELL